MFKSGSNVPVVRHLLELCDDVRHIRTREPALAYDPTYHTAIDRYLDEFLYRNSKYSDRRGLNRFEYQVYSESGEDGIIDEIFKRIGVTGRVAVEFGASDGMRNNSTLLLVKGWRAVWFEHDAALVGTIHDRFGRLVRDGRLGVVCRLVDAGNVEAVFAEASIPVEPDLLNISVDGNDYWIWKALTNWRPRLVVIEYNSVFPPDVRWVMAYNPQHRWQHSSYFGASLKSLELLGREKGYRLVGCNFTGVKAFFVRDDLAGDAFLEPFTAEMHYEPPRYFLIRHKGHPPGFGDFESI